jgi:DNA-binding CsgD family transcriptional regulator
VTQEDDLSPLVSRAYQAAVEPNLWPDLLREFSDSIGGIAGALHWFDRSTGAHVYGSHSGLLDDGLAEYADHYWAQDPRVKWAFTHPPGDVFVDYNFTSERQMDRSEYYSDFLRRQGLRYCIGIVALNERNQHCGIAVHRSRRQGAFDMPEMRIVRRLVPHFRRAVQLQERFSAVQARERCLSDAIDRLAMGTIFVDSGSRPLQMNRAAENILRQGDGLVATRNGLAAAQSAVTASLRRAVFEAAATGAGRGFAAGAAMRLPRPSAKRPLEILIAPLPDHHQSLGPTAPAAVVFVTDPHHIPRTRTDLLAELHGLTRAEAELAEALVEGKTLASFAEETGRRPQTVRKTMKQVFAKTDTARQSELVLRLVTGPAVVNSAPLGTRRRRRG